MADTKYVFVDANHLTTNVESILKYVYGESRPVDYSQVRKVESANRVFVYDGVPAVKSPSQNDQQFEDARTAALIRVSQINRAGYVHARSGVVVGEGRRRRQRAWTFTLPSML